MNLYRYKLSEEERALLVDMTDFGVPLYELLNDVRLSHPESSNNNLLEIAKSILLSVVEKGLVCLCKLTFENTKDNIYEVSETTSMAIDDIMNHIAESANWEQSTDSVDGSITYELAPTDLGEKALDEIFNINQSN
jgi:hypothetical protein